MKKLFALLLVLTMMAAAVPAGAETLAFAPGTPTACGLETFQMYFNMIEEQSGYPFVWNDAPETDGDYQVYTGRSEDGMMTVNVYTSDGNLVYVEGLGNITASLTDETAMRKFGEWFGAAVSGVCFSMFVGENGVAAVSEEVNSQFTSDVMNLSTMLSSKTQTSSLLDSVALSTAVLGYPVGLQLGGAQTDTDITLTMRLLVTGADGSVTVE